MDEETDSGFGSVLISDGDEVLANGTGFVLNLLELTIFRRNEDWLGISHVRSLDGDFRDLIGDAKGGTFANFVIEVEEKPWFAIVDEVPHKRDEVIKKREVRVVEVEIEDDFTGLNIASSNEDGWFAVRFEDGGEVIDKRVVHILLEKDVTVHADTTGEGLIKGRILIVGPGKGG